MAKTEYKPALTYAKGISGRVNDLVVPYASTARCISPFNMGNVNKVVRVQPLGNLSSIKSPEVPYGATVEIRGKTVARKSTPGQVKIQNMSFYGALREKEARIRGKILPKKWFAKAPNTLHQQAQVDKATPQRDYDAVLAQYQHLLDQKYSHGLNQIQKEELGNLKKELHAYGEERLRTISQSQEYREFKEAIQILQEFNKNISAQKDRKARR